MRNVGFLFYDVQGLVLDDSTRTFLHACKQRCSKLVVGVFSDILIRKMSLSYQHDRYEMRKELLLNCDEVDDVVQIDETNASIEQLWCEIRFDLYFNGGVYGQRRKQDIRFLEDRSVEIVTVYEHVECDINTLRVAIEQRVSERKIVLFGAGKYFDVYMNTLGGNFVPELAIDNNPQKWNTKQRGILIKNPKDFFMNEKSQDYTVIICSKNYQEMERQLLDNWGDADYKLMAYHPVVGLLEEYINIDQNEKEYLDSIHRDSLKLLAEFDRVCRENNLRYYAACGTLIGVVRHHDFIPWDDDVDITMPAPDFDNFKKIAEKEWDGNEFLLVDFDDLGKNKFHDFTPRFIYMKSSYPIGTYNKVENISRPEIKNRAALDIFILNDVCRSEFKQFFVDNGIRLIYALCMGHRDIIDYDDYSRWPDYKVRILKLINAVGAKLPMSFLSMLYRKLSRSGEKKAGNMYFKANGNILHLANRINKEHYGDGCDMELRDIKVRVPRNPGGALIEWGYNKNYMNLPDSVYRRPSHALAHKTVKW